MCLKNQIILVLTNQINNDSSKFIEDNSANRYRNSIFLILKKENSSKVDEFISLYIELLSNSEIEVLSLHLLVSLYRKWLIYPLIIEDIKLLLKRLDKGVPNQHFWSLIIENAALDKCTRSMQLARMYLIIHAIRAGMISKQEFESYGIVIKTFLKLHINLNDQQWLKKGFGKDKIHFYRGMFFIVRNLINNGIDKLTLAEIINIHFSKEDKKLEFSESIKAFFQVLESQLPKDYLFYLSPHDLQKIHFIYLNHPLLFDQLKFDSKQIPDLNNIVHQLFQHFMISRTFLHAYVKGYMNEKESNWFIMELTGKNLIYSDQLPFKMTKKAAHFFRCMPEDIGLTVTRSLIYAQMYALIEDERFSLAVAYHIRNISDSNFWIETMSILYKKGLNSEGVNEVMDYINQVVLIQGIRIDIKNKNFENLKRDIEQWHIELYSQKLNKKTGLRKLPDAKLPEFLIMHNDIVYSIIQLKRLSELYVEGKSLKHCVYSYRNFCLKKKSYIFSLRCYYPNKPECILVTIELDDKKQIKQAKGKFNRSTTQEEKLIIQMWAEENNFSIAI